MEEETVVLISSTDTKRIGYIIGILENNNIPYVYNSGFCVRQNSSFVNKEVIISRYDYDKAKKLIEENDEYFSEDAKIIDAPDELKELDEEYFKEQKEKLDKRKQKENIFSKIIIYGVLAFTVIVIILVAFGVI